MATIISFIGAGNMGTSLIGGLIKDHFPANHLWASDPSCEKLNILQQEWDINVTQHNKEAIQHADVIVFAVKPVFLKQVASELAAHILDKQLLISIAAGIPIHSLEQWLGPKRPLIRAMPNTPALIGCGATALAQNAFVTKAQADLSERIFKAVGTVVWLPDENLMDIVTALSGSGPAYFFLILDCLQQAAIELGLPETLATPLTLQTALGAVRMAIEKKIPLRQLKEQVTSKGGTTEKALSVLETDEFRLLFKQALLAAKERSQTLAQQFGES
jgi:pyrroline-5-carboxylate reductase